MPPPVVLTETPAAGSLRVALEIPDQRIVAITASGKYGDSAMRGRKMVIR